MKVAVCFGTGYEEIEALAVVDVLRRGKVDVVMVGVTGSEVTSSRNITVKMDKVIKEVDFDQIDMIVLPGGVPGVKSLEENELLKQQLVKFKNENKWIGAICAAPSILGHLNLLENEEATCYPGYESELNCKKQGEIGVVTSGKIVTASGAGYSINFGLELLKIIKGEEVANKVKNGMLI